MLIDLGLDTSVPSFAILVDGQDVTEGLKLVSLETARMLDRLPYAHLILTDGDPAAQTFALSEASTFAPGAEIEVLLGYTQTNQTVFKGVVTSQRVEAALHGAPRLYVEARHPAFRMTHARRSRVWQDVTDADAIGELVQARGLTFNGTTEAVHPVLVQHQASDWDFAVMRAQMAGQGVLAVDGGVTLVNPGPASPEAKITYGGETFSIEMEVDVERQPAEVEVGAWDPAEAEVVTAASAGPPFVGPGSDDYETLGTVGGTDPKARVSGPRDAAELDAWAGSEALRRRMSALRGAVEVKGAATYVAGMTVTLAGLGTRFDGPSYVSGVRHQLSRGAWRTFLQVGIEPCFHRERVAVEAPAAGGLLPGIRGLQIGTVDALEGDPAGEGRISVILATETEGSGPIWARVMSVGGGAGRGLVMLPEIGDEVLLAFLDGDPRDPVVVGGLHSTAADSPFPGADANHLKGWSSREGMRIAFDDEVVALTVETPGGHTLRLDDGAGEVAVTDSNGNTVTLSAGGIALDAQGDLTLSATGEVTIEGLNVALKAQAEMTAEGGAAAKLTSSGQTTVKGSLVAIN